MALLDYIFFWRLFPRRNNKNVDTIKTPVSTNTYLEGAEPVVYKEKQPPLNIDSLANPFVDTSGTQPQTVPNGFAVDTRSQRPPNIAAGRSSQPEFGLLAGNILDNVTTTPTVPTQLIEVCEQLAIYSDDFSYAVDNIVTLGGTEFDVFLPDDIPQRRRAQIRAEIENWKKNCYAGGVTILVGDLLAQIVTSGALSAEGVVNKNLTGVDGVVLVPTKNVRAAYSYKENDWKWYQTNFGVLPADRLDYTAAGIALNPTTYQYTALRRIGTEKPYGVPPLLAALEGEKLESEMMCDVKRVLTKMGGLGFLEALVRPPAQLPGETPQQWQDRTVNYLQNEIAPMLEIGTKKGYVVGYKDFHEFQLHDTMTNVNGFEAIFNLISTKKMAGIKQDPVMLGRNQSTTETLGRVILAKLGKQVGYYQTIVAAFIEKMLFLHLSLKGFEFGGFLQVKFRKPMIGDDLREAQTETAKIGNVNTKLTMGIISQQQAAEELGYEKPYTEKPPTVVPQNTDTGKPKNGGADVSNTEPTKRTEANKKVITARLCEKYRKNLRGELVNFYGEREADNCGCGNCEKMGGNHTPGAEKFADGENEDINSFPAGSAIAILSALYFTKVFAQYQKSGLKATKLISARLATLPENSTLETVINTVLGVLYKVWGKSFIEPITPIVEKQTGNIYRYFRKDKTPFGAEKAPAAKFDLLDMRALEFWGRYDTTYLGKFITDEDTRKRITSWLQIKYLGENKELPVGKNAGEIKEFSRAFPDVLNAESWKINRIVNTTANKMRAFGAINYLSQAEVKEYTIFGVTDRLQCPFCKAMAGKTFTIASAISVMQKVVESKPEQTPDITPFVNSIFTVEEVKTATGTQLAQKGVLMPPFHANCRDSVVLIATKIE